jgi:tetratricopeptide (TPR) repeat protein
VLDPNRALPFNNRGNAYSEKKDYDRAAADYNEAIRLDPKSVLAFYIAATRTLTRRTTTGR